MRGAFRLNQPPAQTIVAIIPLYNGERYIEHSLRSVLGQTRPPDEIVVADDGSEDNGAAVATAIAGEHPGFQLIKKENGGQSSARNLGVKHSRGSLIALLDQDDIWYPCHLERLAQPFEENRVHRLGWTYSNVDEIDQSGRFVTRRLLAPHLHPKQNIFQCLRQDMFVLPSGSMFSRELFEEIGGFDEDLRGYEDDDFFLRAFRMGYDNVFIDESLSIWRIHTDSTSYSNRMLESRLRYARKLIAEYPDIPERRQYISRDLIAPRFVLGFLSCIYDSAKFGRPMQLKLAKQAMKELVPYLKTSRHLPLKMMLPVLTNYHAIRFLMRTGLIDLAAKLLLRRQSRISSSLRK